MKRSCADAAMDEGRPWYAPIACDFYWRAVAAAKLEDPERLTKLLESHPDGAAVAFRSAERHGNQCAGMCRQLSLLAEASGRGHERVVETMLSWGADPNPHHVLSPRNVAFSGALLSPLSTAVEVTTLLLRAQSNPGMQQSNEQTFALVIANRRHDDAGQLVHLLLQAPNTDCLRVDKEEQSWLISLACKLGKPACLRAMLGAWQLWDASEGLLETLPFAKAAEGPSGVRCLQTLMEQTFSDEASATMSPEQKKGAMTKALVRCLAVAAQRDKEELCMEALGMAAAEDGMLSRVAKTLLSMESDETDEQDPTCVLLHLAQAGMVRCVGRILLDKEIVSWANAGFDSGDFEFYPFSAHDDMTPALQLTLLVQACRRLVPAPVVEVMVQSGLTLYGAQGGGEEGPRVDSLMAACFGRPDDSRASAGEVVSVLLAHDATRRLNALTPAMWRCRTPLFFASERMDVACLKAMASGGALDVDDPSPSARQAFDDAYLTAAGWRQNVPVQLDGHGAGNERRREFVSWLLRLGVPLPDGGVARERIMTRLLTQSDAMTLLLLASRGLTPPTYVLSPLAAWVRTWAPRWRHEHLMSLWRDATRAYRIYSWIWKKAGERVCATNGATRAVHLREYELEQ